MKIRSRFHLLLLALSALALPAHAQPTAYQALDHLKDARGAGALGNVMLIRGVAGHPTPAAWSVFRCSPGTRSFTTERIESDGAIRTGQASTLDAGLDPHAEPLNFKILNLDSNAALRIAHREAISEKFKFSAADYELKTNSLYGGPAWTLTLFNEQHGFAATITISAVTGVILRPIAVFRYNIVDSKGGSLVQLTPEPFASRALRSIGRWFSNTGSNLGSDLLRATSTTEEILLDQRTHDDRLNVE